MTNAALSELISFIHFVVIVSFLISYAITYQASAHSSGSAA